MLDTRVDSSPLKEEFFPSTRLAAQYIQDNGEIVLSSKYATPTNSFDPIAGSIHLGFYAYSFVELFSAIVTDVLLAPLDAIVVWMDHRDKNEFVEQYEEMEIEPVN